MTFQVPASKASIDQDKFKFSVPGDKRVYALKRFKFLTLGQAEKIEDPETMRDLITAMFGSDEKAAAAVRGLEQEQFKALLSAWQADSEVEPGESPAS